MKILNYKQILMKSRKGMDKPIFVVASLVLAMMFIALYFTAASGWLDMVLDGFLSDIGSIGIEEGVDE